LTGVVAPYLIDTNIISELTRRAPNPTVVAFLNDHSDLLISVIVFHELEYGIHCAVDAERRAKLQAYCLAFRHEFAGRIIEVDLAIAETAGRLRAFEKARGRVLAELDAIIGATAMVNGATLVTRNTKDFDQVGIPLLNPWEAT
jgi:predicted nucleic acid-binding protein